MSKEFDEENNIFNGNDITFMTPLKDIKVMIWGYELCKGAEWKDFLDVVNKLGEEKADLEAKLAERKEFCISQTQSLLDINNALIEENAELKQQLAEKDKEIESLRSSAYIEMLHKEKLELKVATHNKDKISFAVEQLEKLKIELHYLHTDRYLKLIDEAIDNQIEELKREMKYE